MKNYEIGTRVHDHCLNCFSNEQKVVEVVSKEFTDRVVETLWLQCINCGKLHSRLVQHDY